MPHIHLSRLSVADAAELCGYKVRSLRRKLKNEGTTLTKEINKLRKEKAIGLLVETDKTIAEVGYSVGIINPSVFTRSFRQWTGMSPKKYRDNHQKT
ncbi:MAG: helix-turn-helix transcriptional regulator [Gammaproteobacteria bacterium]|nr:helix-turn-helix transcriptional regulator [Gammaproteobacteria bacterium]